MTDFIVPDARQQEWADCEIGVIIHQDLQTYVPEWQEEQGTEPPPPEAFAPSDLDTDQWLEAAVALGAKYAVLVVKHGTGFSLWPTRAHDYSVASSPWRDGRGDVVRDFLASCRKYGVRPGVYASSGWSAKFRVKGNRLADGDDPARWAAYVEMVKTQLRELWSDYGQWFEIWFDGGMLPGKSGEEISDMLRRLQPGAVVFQGNPETCRSIRWIGNERADAPYPCWGRTDDRTEEDGKTEYELSPRFYGNANGNYWMPGEADMPNRDQSQAFMSGWFWRPGEDWALYPPAMLLERYYSSVGRNCNWLLGMPIDNRGRVPDADFRQFAETGRLIRRQYEICRGKISGQGLRLEIANPGCANVDMIALAEEIEGGENIFGFDLYGFDGEHCHFLANGKSVGHKFLIRLPRSNYPAYRLNIYSHRPGTEPRIREFALYDTGR